MQAKFLHFYPGYTWDSMNEPRKLPFATFVSLYRMIDAVQADTALECDIPAIWAALGNGIDRIKQKTDDVYEIVPEFLTIEAKEADNREAYRISSAIRKANNNKKVALKKKG